MWQCFQGASTHHACISILSCTFTFKSLGFLYCGSGFHLVSLQAGLLLWKLLFPNDKKSKAKRADALKADVLTVAVKMFSNIEHPVATPAAGIISVFCLEAETERETALTARPSVLASIYKALSCPSVALITEASRLLRIFSVSPDSRARVLKAAKDWDLKILLSACSLKVCFCRTQPSVDSCSDAKTGTTPALSGCVCSPRRGNRVSH